MSFNRTTKATVIMDSVNQFGTRLTTMEVTFHRFILAEVNTHRKFSRNSASSRAIPLETMLNRAVMHPALPIKWPREQPGMSGGDELTGDDLHDAEELLLAIRDETTTLINDYIARHPDKSTRLHKSLLNRPLEWFMWHTAIISSTEWGNMFHQRISPTAQPEFYELAVAMKDALDDSTPTERQPNEMHLPYTTMEERSTLSTEELIKISTARCARVSYLTHDGKRDIAEDVRMFDETLWSNGHWSPMEHPAIATATISPLSNFDAGWVQVRQFAERNQWDMLLEYANRLEES